MTLYGWWLAPLINCEGRFSHTLDLWKGMFPGHSRHTVRWSYMLLVFPERLVWFGLAVAEIFRFHVSTYGDLLAFAVRRSF